MSASPGAAVICIVGARPNAMEVAPIMLAFAVEPPPRPASWVRASPHHDPARVVSAAPATRAVT